MERTHVGGGELVELAGPDGHADGEPLGGEADAAAHAWEGGGVCVCGGGGAGGQGVGGCAAAMQPHRGAAAPLVTFIS